MRAADIAPERCATLREETEGWGGWGRNKLSSSAVPTDVRVGAVKVAAGNDGLGALVVAGFRNQALGTGVVGHALVRGHHGSHQLSMRVPSVGETEACGVVREVSRDVVPEHK